MVGSEPELRAENPTFEDDRFHLLSKRGVWVGLALTLALAAILAHLRMASAGIDYRGRLAILDRVFDVLLALLLWALAFCIGRSVCRKLSLSFSGVAEEM